MEGKELEEFEAEQTKKILKTYKKYDFKSF